MSSAAPISARLWASGRSLADLLPSPDGETLAFVVTNGPETHLATMPAGGGAETWLPCQPSIKRSGGVLSWRPDTEEIAYIGSDGCIYLIDLASYQCRAVTSLGQPLSALAMSPDGSQLAYVVDTAEVVVASLTELGAPPLRLSSGADFVFDPCWSPDSRTVAWHEWDVPNMAWDTSRICQRLADGSSPIATMYSVPEVSVAQPRFSPDGTKLSFLCDAGGFLNVWAIDADGGDEAKPLISDNMEHGGPSWGPAVRTYGWSIDGNSIVFSRNAAGWGSLWRHDMVDGKRMHVDDGFYTGVGFVGDDIVGLRRGVENGTTLVRTTAAGELRVLMRSTVDGLGHGIEPRLVEWNNSAGDLIHGRLYEPAEPVAEAPPMLVWVHGGPHGQSPATAYGRFGYYVERGWSVLNIDYRGTTGWGREFAQALNGHWGDHDVDDVATGIGMAHARGWGDPKRTVLYGGSAGGLTALLVAARHPELSQAAVILYPVTDLLAFDEETWRFEAHYTERLVGPLPAAEEEYRRRSPVSYVDRYRQPMLLLQGDSDVVVPAKSTQLFVDRVNDAGGSAKLWVYEGEGHGWRNSATEIDELERVEAFLNKHVLHEPTKEETR